jgi:large subunit ribosomal protein L9
MARHLELLLLKSVENLGIVGDTVKVRPGFARNFLLPMKLADVPTPSRIEALKEDRAKAQAELSRLRSAREELHARMEDVAVTIQRSCNDQGVLYGSVTQRDIADALQAAGYDVGVRSIRLAQTIRRIGEYHVPIQFERDLRTEVVIKVTADRTLEEFVVAEAEKPAETEGKTADVAADATEGEAKPKKKRSRKDEDTAE